MSRIGKKSKISSAEMIDSDILSKVDRLIRKDSEGKKYFISEYGQYLWGGYKECQKKKIYIL